MRKFMFLLFGFCAIAYFLVFARTVMYIFTDNPYWIFVSIGILLPTLVLIKLVGVLSGPAKNI